MKFRFAALLLGATLAGLIGAGVGTAAWAASAGAARPESVGTSTLGAGEASETSGALGKRSSHDHYKAPPLDTLGGPFSLTDHTGRAVTHETFLGKWLLAFVGYMSCEDVCPVALQTMAIAFDELAPDKAGALQMAFMDFDDDRADLGKLGQFVGQFHPAILGLTGTRKQTWAILRAFKVRRDHGGRFYPVPTEMARTTADPSKGMLRQTAGEGRINHTSRLYLIGPDGKVKAFYYHDIAPTTLARKIAAEMMK